jgi:hypothetical protein
MMFLIGYTTVKMIVVAINTATIANNVTALLDPRMAALLKITIIPEKKKRLDPLTFFCHFTGSQNPCQRKECGRFNNYRSRV